VPDDEVFGAAMALARRAASRSPERSWKRNSGRSSSRTSSRRSGRCGRRSGRADGLFLSTCGQGRGVFPYIWNSRITGRAHSTCASEADPVRHLAASTCSNGVRAREVGGYTYLYITDPVDHPGRHWDRIPTASLGDLPSINSFTAAAPRQMLAEIKKADKVTVVGPASGPGWTGTRYAFSGSPGAGIKLSGTVTVDQQGRARALVLTIRLTGAINVFVTTQVLTFSGFGAPVTVTPPPADQTFSGP
jgi:hypothetical protein